VPPRLTRAGIAATIAIAAADESGEAREVAVCGEYPLTLYADKRELVTLMTMGQMPEALAVGYLRNQRLVDSVDDILSVTVDWEVAAAAIKTKSGLRGVDTAKRTITSGCGQGTMFGDLMEDIERASPPRARPLTKAALADLLDKIRQRDTVYKKAGAVHGCALAENRESEAGIMLLVEDVGRHNAVDAIAGWMWLNNIGGADKIFYTTGRLTSEMVIKCAQMRIPYLVSRSGLTKMGYEIAKQTGITMIGRAVGKRYLVFTGARHLI
jgi:FdhD protein